MHTRERPPLLSFSTFYLSSCRRRCRGGFLTPSAIVPPHHASRLPLPMKIPKDIEFTVENGRLYMLQCRNGKRTAKAAVKIAVDMVS